jgi:DNA replication and repair protein RecF
MSELDIERQEYLIKTLKENQLFITTTDLDQKLFDAFPEAKVIYIDGGKMKEKNSEN